MIQALKFSPLADNSISNLVASSKILVTIYGI